jgi:hypothetical protein
MHPITPSRLALLCTALLLSACATQAPTPLPPITPGPPGAPLPPGTRLPPVEEPSLGWFSKIKAPDGQVPILQLAARGVQVFRCERRNGALQWSYRLPEADLTDASGTVVARHGVDFSFEHGDGSRLLGKVVASEEAPRDGNLRWLLLATRSFGEGNFTGVSYVQRVNTNGGMPPPACDARQLNQLLRVDFSADFVFYRPG